MAVEFRTNRIARSTLDDKLSELISGLASPAILMNEAGVIVQEPIQDRLAVIIKLMEILER